LMAAVEAVEKPDCKHQRTRAFARQLVTHVHTKTLRGANNAPNVSPTPTSVRD
jgi:hypothetical protein